MASSIVFYIASEVKNERIEIALQDNLQDLQTHYKILIYNQSVSANAAYHSTTVFMKEFTEIMSKVSTASPKEKDILRQRLHHYLKAKYDLLKTKGVLQFHFVLPNNESFLRMHKPSKFGDNLTDIREDFKYVNSNKEPIAGFTQGRTAHGFRNTYPLFDKDGTHLGAMEISFSSDSLQEYLTNISKIHTHFIVNKNIFNAKAWKRDDLILKYSQSLEHENFMLTMNKEHLHNEYLVKNALIVSDKRDEINKHIKIGDKFSVYSLIDYKQVVIASFFPIKNLAKTKTLAWIVSYEDSPFVYSSIVSFYILQIIAFMVLSLLVFLFYRLKEHENQIQKQADTDTLTGIYNRNKFDKILSYELSRSVRYDHKLCVAILDIDFFKKFNDNYGHLIGDEVLVMLAKNINDTIRETDTFARWGGEEFILLFPETSLVQASEICDKLRLGIEHNPHPSAGKVTASFGLTVYEDRDTIDTIFKRCDSALYLAKECGRNRVCTR